MVVEVRPMLYYVTTVLTMFTMTSHLSNPLTARLASQHSPSSQGQSYLSQMLIVFRAHEGFGEYIGCLFRVMTIVNCDQILLDQFPNPVPSDSDVFAAVMELLVFC